MSAGQILAAAAIVGGGVLAAGFLAGAALAGWVWVAWRRECRDQARQEAQRAAEKARSETVAFWGPLSVAEAEAIVRRAARGMHLPG
ncbi:hypothetical protein [Tersicoccus sp. Bi-70]|uniref:hypothetical protein n=1 Tax=Tersicoccus sp. Bi-70 TaxID=1897634 RepID=UPI000977A4F3|nr:hypothetical protein [Tersicoccus sp. Bi-70]OMH30620.1 hypothetical protein BGP79_11720 [Tersicoccus sp. Bi-70]